MNQKISQFRGRYGFLCYTCSSTPTYPLFQTLLVDLHHRCSCWTFHCLTDWGRELLSVQHIFLSCQRVKYRYGRPLSTWPTKTSTTRSFAMGQYQQTPVFMLRTVGSQGASIQHCATRIKSLSWPLTCSARNLDRTRGTNAGGNR